MDAQTFTFTCTGQSAIEANVRCHIDSLRRAGPRIDQIEIIVVPRVAAWIQRPSFQKLALSPFKSLLPGSNSRRRELIDCLKTTLKSSTQKLASFVDENAAILAPVFVEATRRWYRARSWILSDGLSLSELRGRIDGFSAQLEEEWVSADDYFGPIYNVWGECENGEWLQRGEYIIDFNPELRYAGNSVARCMLTRAKIAVDQLECFLSELRAGLVAANAQRWPGAEILDTPKRLLAELRRAVLHEKTAALEECAIILLQTYLAFWPGDCDLSWLPVADRTRDKHRDSLQRALRSARGEETAKDIERALRAIEKWLAGQDESLSDLEEAISTGGLVIQTSSRRAYWECQPIDLDWTRHARLWELLLALAQSRGRTVVTPSSIYGNTDSSKDFRALRTLKCELIRKLPSSIRSLIRAVHGQQCYRLDLGSDRIFLLDS